MSSHEHPAQADTVANRYHAGDMADAASRGFQAGVRHALSSDGPVALAIAIADEAARVDVEIWSCLVDLDGVRYFDTTRVPADGFKHDDALELGMVARAVKYIEERGDALPFFRMQRHIDAPHLVRFEDRADGEH